MQTKFNAATVVAMLCVAPPILCGCGYVPKTQFNACESQARILSEQSKAQLAEIANLKSHAKKLEDDLLKAEKELTAAQRGTDADRKRLANLQVEREKVQEQVKGLVRGATLTGIVPVRDDEIERLMKQFPLLRFDAATGAYKLDAELAFQGDEVRITPESQKLLNEFAALFAEPGTRDLRVLVVGRTPPAEAAEVRGAEHRLGTERALAVADYLRKVGLRGEQIGVSGLGAQADAAGKNAPPAAAGKPRRVDIFVMGKKTPIVGWDDLSAGRF